MLDDVLEYGVGHFVREIAIDGSKIGIVGPAVSDLIMQGQNRRNPEGYLKACRKTKSAQFSS